MCEYEGRIERDRYSEVLLILITVWDWSADNDVGCNFYIDLKLMAFRALKNILLIESGIPTKLNCPFAGTRQAYLFFPVRNMRTFCCFLQAWGDRREVQESGEQAWRSAGDRWTQRHGGRERSLGQEAGGECVSVVIYTALMSISLHHTIKLLTTAGVWISSRTFQRFFYDLDMKNKKT